MADRVAKMARWLRTCLGRRRYEEVDAHAVAASLGLSTFPNGNIKTGFMEWLLECCDREQFPAEEIAQTRQDLHEYGCLEPAIPYTQCGHCTPEDA